jgi:hypothetical protein
LGSGILLGLEVDSRADGTDSDAEAVVKSLVAHRVRRVLTRNPDGRGVWREASLTVGGQEKAMTEVFDQNKVPQEEPNQASGRQQLFKKKWKGIDIPNTKLRSNRSKQNQSMDLRCMQYEYKIDIVCEIGLLP